MQFLLRAGDTAFLNKSHGLCSSGFIVVAKLSYFHCQSLQLCLQFPGESILSEILECCGKMVI